MNGRIVLFKNSIENTIQTAITKKLVSQDEFNRATKVCGSSKTELVK